MNKRRPPIPDSGQMIFTIGEAAPVMRLSESHLRELIKAKLLHARTLPNGEVRIHRDHIKQFFNECDSHKTVEAEAADILRHVSKTRTGSTRTTDGVNITK